MVLQWIITLGILAAALAFAALRIYRYFKKPSPDKSACEQFAGDCTACLQRNPQKQHDCNPS